MLSDTQYEEALLALGRALGLARSRTAVYEPQAVLCSKPVQEDMIVSRTAVQGSSAGGLLG